MLWDHTWPVSRECGTTRLGYDFVLRLEEMNLWYSAFLLHFDLRYFVDALSADGFNLFELTMNDDALLRDYSAQVTGFSLWGGKAWNSSHHRGSADKVAEYYTPELAAWSSIFSAKTSSTLGTLLGMATSTRSDTCVS